MIELTEPAFAFAPAEHDAKSSVSEQDRARRRHVHVEPARRLDAFEKEVGVPVLGKGMDFDV